MRLTYLCAPLFAVLLVGCGDDDNEVRPVDEAAPNTQTDDNYGTPGSANTAPTNSTMPRPTDEDDGLGTEYGTQPGNAPPASGTGTGSGSTGMGTGTGTGSTGTQ